MKERRSFTSYLSLNEVKGWLIFMEKLTKSQKQQLKESYRRGIIRELYSKSLLTGEQYRRLMMAK